MADLVILHLWTEERGIALAGLSRESARMMIRLVMQLGVQ
jgi:hypothetical protein